MPPEQAQTHDRRRWRVAVAVWDAVRRSHVAHQEVLADQLIGDLVGPAVAYLADLPIDPGAAETRRDHVVAFGCELRWVFPTPAVGAAHRADDGADSLVDQVRRPLTSLLASRHYVEAASSIPPTVVDFMTASSTLAYDGGYAKRRS